ncbi:hybrid sensor histidine kinase/response regulator [Synechococcus sp. PCC 6312]|uniref:hybrid sensor histidine kinase/response regulator n=1 Tax=Synechococcus sp. (strain ATCC 27167 / PCC 6312) TaxID=195253 RepID=UPI00029F3445|nr:hybrid sensor histidine kinase/response regulator [Synechococcus sp. PCC 6312]AFY62688.1 chemotaxis protein histidine kinase-like protein [Synechococcus sp. PCC 6312]
MPLNAADLDAITREARLCFLQEDAPEYLGMLEQGVQALTRQAQPSLAAYSELMRAAHTLKGGAGIAQLPDLQQVAHRLEDLLEALHQGRARDYSTAHELLALGVEEIHGLVVAATEAQSPQQDPNRNALLQALDQFLNDLPSEALPQKTSSTGISPIVQAVLTTDLEDSLKQLEAAQSHPSQALNAALNTFLVETKLLGQTLNLAWLTEVVEHITVLRSEAPLAELVPAIISEIRLKRAEFLAGKLAPSPQNPTPATPESSPPLEPTSRPPQLEPTAKSEKASLNLRIPLTRMDRMGNTVSELLISQERLNLYQAQFQQISRELKRRISQFGPIREQVQTLYDRLATAPSLKANGHHLPLGVSPDPAPEFDSLEFDRYTELHSTLQDFQEIMARIQETGADIDLLNRELQAALDDGRQFLGSLRADLTDARLVPFRVVAERFIPALNSLSQRYQKPLSVEIHGENTLLDQAILEQLKTPLTHLVRNAFDHGVEPAAVRQRNGKHPTAKIILSAKVSGNQVLISVVDDGQGVNLEKVTQKAVQKGLCPAEAVSLLTEEQILEFLFAPGFSTAAEVGDLSGRGVGLDVVRLQVERLRGTIRVSTKPQQGTTFTLALPLTLNILPLLLCQTHDFTLAIPSVNILEVIKLSEFMEPGIPTTRIIWKDQTIPYAPLQQFLPYARPTKAAPLTAAIGVVVEVNERPMAVGVDALLEEREFVLKPFDTTIKVPPYVMGCTVLGTGAVVPVLSPPQFELLLQSPAELPASPPPPPELSRPDQVTLMIVDDSVAVRRLLERVLTQAGYGVISCRDGQEAWEQLNRISDPIRLIISDVEMPRMDGFALLQEVRHHPQWEALPVAMLTSRSGDQHRYKAQQLGANAYFVKPFQPVDLVNQIAKLIQKSAYTPV